MSSSAVGAARANQAVQTEPPPPPVISSEAIRAGAGRRRIGPDGLRPECCFPAPFRARLAVVTARATAWERFQATLGHPLTRPEARDIREIIHVLSKVWVQEP